MASPAATVLIADDTRATARALAELLVGAGLSVEFAVDGPEALRRALEPGIDLVLLDLALPELDGLQVLRLLRARTDRRHVPVLVVTVTQDPQTKLAALQLGADEVLEKPWDVEVLLARVRRCLELKLGWDALQAKLVAKAEEAGEGLLSAPLFDARLREELRRAQRYSDPLALVLLALNVPPNAREHERLLRALRESVRETDLLSHHGDNLYAALLPKTSLAGGLTAAERMLNRLRDSRLSSPVSLGVAAFPSRTHEGPGALWTSAKQALEQAKQEGGNRIRLFSQALEVRDPGVPSPRPPGRF